MFAAELKRRDLRRRWWWRDVSIIIFIIIQSSALYNKIKWYLNPTDTVSGTNCHNRWIEEPQHKKIPFFPWEKFVNCHAVGHRHRFSPISLVISAVCIVYSGIDVYCIQNAHAKSVRRCHIQFISVVIVVGVYFGSIPSWCVERICIAFDLANVDDDDDDDDTPHHPSAPKMSCARILCASARTVIVGIHCQFQPYTQRNVWFTVHGVSTEHWASLSQTYTMARREKIEEWSPNSEPKWNRTATI